MADCPHSGFIVDYLIEPMGVKSLEFLEHSRSCSLCTGRIEQWSQIEEALTVEGDTDCEGSAHPAPELLYAYRHGHDLSHEIHAGVARHLSQCPACRSELAALDRFDFAHAAEQAQGDPERAIDTPANQERADLIARVLSWLGFDSGRAWAPAMAVLLLLVIGTWGWLMLEDSSERRIPSDPTFASGDASMSDRIEPGRPRTNPAGAGDQVLDGFEEAFASIEEPEIEAEIPIEPATGTLEDARSSRAESAADPRREHARTAPASDGVLEDSGDENDSSGRPTPTSPSEESVPQERPAEILLASLASSPAPRYRAPEAVEPFEYSGNVVRSSSENTITEAPMVLAPRHVVRTHQESPSLYWVLGRRSPVDAEVSLVQASSGDVIMEYQIQGPLEAGLFEVDLADRGVELDPGVEYRLYVSLIMDPRRRSLDLRSAAGLRRQPMPSGLETAIEAAESPGHAYADQGLWVDALEFFSGLAEAAEDSEQTALAIELRDALLESAELSPPPRN